MATKKKTRRKKSGGNKKLGANAKKAKRIRKKGESWPSALKRAAK